MSSTLFFSRVGSLVEGLPLKATSMTYSSDAKTGGVWEVGGTISECQEIEIEKGSKLVSVMDGVITMAPQHT